MQTIIPTTTDYLEFLIKRGGPTPDDYPSLDLWLRELHDAFSKGELQKKDIQTIRTVFAEALSLKTMQGFAFCKPHGYAGDFEIIDKIYLGHVTEEPHLKAWDEYYHQQPATKAVRNRKEYFHSLLDWHKKSQQTLRVLNVASGPGRCMFEWLSKNPNADCSFECVEMDERAISHALQLNKHFADRLVINQSNLLHWRTNGYKEKFNLIWASEIFDYFNDRIFRTLIQRLIPLLNPEGEIVIGNFSSTNPSRPYMEIVGDWVLHHRSPQQLESLAIQCGIDKTKIVIGCEPEGVNLFLHVKR